ncbi:MAG: CHAD domain-containing protein [Lentimicrobiaceae bacterium]|nr:CHAD domain-containing protein [Lentimicrobiaceae bacterium]
MLKRLETYFLKHHQAFISNYALTINSFDSDAIHDLRVAIKRMRAVYVLLEKIFPEKFAAKEAEGALHELFRLSGRMRDAQVQQKLTATYEQKLNCSFTEYQHYLKIQERKAIRKFLKYLEGYEAETDMALKMEAFKTLMGLTDDETIRLNIINHVDELMHITKSMIDNQDKDENLHEIRRKLKECHYLLAVLKKNDPALPTLEKTLKTLDTTNNLLGEWHDQIVGMDTLGKFMQKKQIEMVIGINRYHLLGEHLAQDRLHLHSDIMRLIEQELKI